MSEELNQVDQELIFEESTVGGSAIDNRYRGRDLKDQLKQEWKEECVYCTSKNLVIHPIDIVYQPHTVSDYSDLPVDVRPHFVRLPNIAEAVQEAAQIGNSASVLVECIECKMFMRGFLNKDEYGVHESTPNQQKLKAYLVKLYGLDDGMTALIEEQRRLAIIEEKHRLKKEKENEKLRKNFRRW